MAIYFSRGAAILRFFPVIPGIGFLIYVPNLHREEMVS